jgi:hypothetical protein
MNESAADDRRSRFLSWAEKQLSRIQALALPSCDEYDNSADDRSHIREIKKTAILSLLDTLAKAFEGGGKGRLVYDADKDNWGKFQEYHLVYPLSFLTKLVNDCIDSFREDPGVDPYPRFSLGPYLIQQLNGNG